MRPRQSPTAALPIGTPIMKGKWERIETSPRDGRPVWCIGFVDDTYNVEGPFWGYYAEDDWHNAGTYEIAIPLGWFNPEAAP